VLSDEPKMIIIRCPQSLEFTFSKNYNNAYFVYTDIKVIESDIKVLSGEM